MDSYFSDSALSNRQFVRELHRIGSLPALLNRFSKSIGWKLSYHCADSVPKSLQRGMSNERSVSVFPGHEEERIPMRLSPEFLEEIAEGNEIWIPIEIKRGFLKMKLEEFIQREVLECSKEHSRKKENSLPFPILEMSRQKQNDVERVSKDDESELIQKVLEPVRLEFEKELEKSISGNLEFLNYPIGFLRLSCSDNEKLSSNDEQRKVQSGESLVDRDFLLSEDSTGKSRDSSRISFQEARSLAVALGDLISEFQFMRFRVWFLELEGTLNILPKPGKDFREEESRESDYPEYDSEEARLHEERYFQKRHHESGANEIIENQIFHAAGDRQEENLNTDFFQEAETHSGTCLEGKSGIQEDRNESHEKNFPTNSAKKSETFAEKDFWKKPYSESGHQENSEKIFLGDKALKNKDKISGKSLLEQFVSSRSPERNRFVGDFRKLLTYSCLALGMDAVGIYLPNFENQTFKLRAHYGLAMDQLMSEIRHFGRAQTDLRVYHQNAVITIDDSWPEGMGEIPEDFPSAVCIPLRSRNFSYGTVWFFSNKTFIPEKTTRLVELFGELFALNIENEHFQRQESGTLEYRRELKAASRFQTLMSPIYLAGNFEIAGWTKAGRTLQCLRIGNSSSDRQLGTQNSVSGDFYEWLTLPDGQTLVALGSVGTPGLAGAMLAASVRSALRSHASYGHSVSELLAKVNQTLWLQLAADARISLFCAVIRPEPPYLGIHFAQTGNLRGLKIGNSGTFQEIPLSHRETSRSLGSTSDFHCFEDCVYLKPYESFVIFNDGLSNGKRELAGDGSSEETFRNFKNFGMDLRKVKQKINQELGRLLSQKRNSSVCLKVSQIRNFFMNHLPMGRYDQSAMALQFVGEGKNETVCCGETRKSRN
ncbi:MAG: hypothetical protein E7028_01990 [Planctomycetaceae bacterium]|nr:hypothetical protein [Planctomycetaceae bacterium]